jgi:hypothetical protein
MGDSSLPGNGPNLEVSPGTTRIPWSSALISNTSLQPPDSVISYGGAVMNTLTPTSPLKISTGSSSSRAMGRPEGSWTGEWIQRLRLRHGSLPL